MDEKPNQLRHKARRVAADVASETPFVRSKAELQAQHDTYPTFSYQRAQQQDALVRPVALFSTRNALANPQ